MDVENLIAEMKALKLLEPTLDLQDILKLFHIQATIDLTNVIYAIGRRLK